VSKSERESGMLATFRSLEMKKVQDVAVSDVKGDLISKTYTIQRTLLIPLAPAWSIEFFILGIIYRMAPVLMLIAFQGGACCAGITLSCWLRDGRPGFSEWSRHVGTTREIA
jgi:hypothetical protein